MDGVDEPCSPTPPTGQQQHQSGHLMCYEGRTSSRALDNHQRHYEWDIENRLHHVRDRTCREDACRVRDQHAARNLAVLRRIAINLVGRDGSTKASMRARRKRAAWDNDYMLQLLAGSLLRPSVEGSHPRVGPCR